MVNAKRARLVQAGALAAMIALAAALAGCAPQTGVPEQDAAPKSNDAAAKGEYTPYDPAVEAEHISGKAIEGSEEEELQQERIAGGAVDTTVKSQNLEPLEGIVDGTPEEYVPVYGIDGEPPAIGHGDNGSDCLSCHKSDGAGAAMPPSHAKANLANEECASCHKAAA